MDNGDFLEDSANLTAPTRDMHRALIALAQHVIALDQGNQRVDACTDSSLLAILSAARDHDKQNIAMLLEWMRRHDTQFNDALRAALFKAGPIAGAD